MSHYLEKASQEMPKQESARLLHCMLAELHDGHTEIVHLFGESNTFSPDILLDEIEEKAVLRSVGEEAQRLGMLPGQ